MPDIEKSAVVLVSGGLDSAVTLAQARSESLELYAISFDYGQRHRCELEAASIIVSAVGAKKHLVFPIDLTLFGASALTDSIEVPKRRTEAEISDGIPVTYVPARNTIFLSLALGWAESMEINRILIGANAIDYSGYPDCRPEFIQAFEGMANLATRLGIEDQRIRIEAPLIDLTKAEIISLGHKLGLDLSLTVSCYDPISDGLACGQCDSCQLRRRGFEEAGLPDVTRYAGQSTTRQKS